MKKVTLFCICIFIVGISVAKNNFRPAIVIGLQNDTLKGFVDFRTDELNSSECRFRSSQNSPDRLFLPDQIQGYRFLKDSKYYISRNILVDSIERATVFLEFLVQGEINLYYYQDFQNNDHYLVEQKKGDLLDVTKKRGKISNVRFKVEHTWYSEASNYTKDKVDEDYRDILANIFQKSRSVKTRAAFAEFERKDLIRLTKQYNEEQKSAGKQAVVFADDNITSFFKAQISFDGGCQYYEYNSVPSFKIQNYSINSRSVMPVVSTQIALSSPRITRFVALIVDVSLSEFKGESDYLGKYATYYTYRYKALEAFSSLGLKYNYEYKRVSPFVEVALSNAIFTFKSSTLNIYDRYFNREDRQNYLLPEDVISGYRLALGCEYKLKNQHSLLAKINFHNLSDYKDQLKILDIRFGYLF